MSFNETLQANGQKKVNVSGRYLALISSQGPVEVGAKGMFPHLMDESDRMVLPEGTLSIIITDVSGATNEITLVESNEPYVSGKSDVGTVEARIDRTVNVKIEGSGVTVPVSMESGLTQMGAGGSVTLDATTPSVEIPANANRKELIIIVPAGGGGVDIDGALIPAGNALTLEVTGSVTVTRSGGDVALSYTQTEKVAV